MTAFTDLRRVTLRGTVARVDGLPAVGVVLVSVDGPTQDRAAGELIVDQPDRVELVDGEFAVSVPAREEPPAPLVEIQVLLDEGRVRAEFQFEVVTDAAEVDWAVTI